MFSKCNLERNSLNIQEARMLNKQQWLLVRGRSKETLTYFKMLQKYYLFNKNHYNQKSIHQNKN